MAKGGQPQTPVAPDDGYWDDALAADERVGIPVPSEPRGGVLGAAADVPLASGLEEVLLDTPAPGGVPDAPANAPLASGLEEVVLADTPAPGGVPDAANVPVASGLGLRPPSVPPLPPFTPPLPPRCPPSLPSSRDPLVAQSARMFSLERENTELKEQLARANLQASSAAVAAQDALADKGAHMFALERENMELERENTELRRHASSSDLRDLRAAALEAEVKKLRAENAHLQGMCGRYKAHLDGANWTAEINRENFLIQVQKSKSLERDFQREYHGNLFKCRRLENEADAAKRQLQEALERASYDRQQSQRARDEADKLCNTWLQSESGLKRRAAERYQAKRTTDPMHPLEA